MSTRSMLAELAISQIGITEVGDTNDNKYGIWFGFNKVAWCAIFQSWLYAQAGVPLKNTSWAHGYASVPELLDKNQANKTESPQTGDLVIYDWQKDGRVDHVGMFLCWIDQVNGIFCAIEGNTSVANQSNGGAVMLRVRTKEFVTAFLNMIDA